MSCDIKLKTLNYMKEKGLMDEQRIIPFEKLEEFNKENEKLTDHAKATKNVDEGLLFSIEEKTIERGYKQSTTFINRAVPNEKAFQAIEAYNASQQEQQIPEQTNTQEIKPSPGEQLTLFQQSDSKNIPASKASKELIEQMKKVAEKMGVNLISLYEYLKGNPNVDAKGVNALADLLKGIIAIAQGKEGVAITEEVVHVATAIIEQVNPKLVTELISKIDRFSIYKKVLAKYSGKKAYQLPNGKPNIRKIKKEAVDKLIAELIVNSSEGNAEFPELASLENRTLVQRMWDAILDVIKGMYRKSDIDIFKQTAFQIQEGEIGGTVSDLSSTETFFQIEKNEKVDSLYDAYKDMDSRMFLADATENEKRHYTYDGEKLPLTVTTKKGEKNIGGTEAQKKIYEAKREWGSEGHKYLENYISTNLIDENGYAKPFTDTEIVSPIDDKLKSKIRTFAKELISSYKPGTRFLIETKVANLKMKQKMGSTIDFIAFEPVENSKGEPDVKVDILDWKFAGFDTTQNDDVPPYSQKDWKEQMGEYTKIAYNLGVERNQLRKARMIPFVVNYKYAIKNNKESELIPRSIQIGKLDNSQETNLYLLPVPVDYESTGNERVDTFLTSLRKLYEKMYSAKVSPEEKFGKITKLNNFSAAIRNLHLRLNFDPLYGVAKTFLFDIKSILDEFKLIDYDKISKEELKVKLEKLIEYQRSAEKFLELDEVYLSHVSREDMTPEQTKLLKGFETVKISTQKALGEILEIQKAYVQKLGLEEGIVREENVDEILEAEKTVSGLDKSFLEGSKLAPKIIKLATKTYLKAKNLANIKFNKMADEYSRILIPLEKEASSMGKSAFEMVGTLTEKGPRLIKKLDSVFLKNIKEAKEKGDKQFLLDNLDLDKYNELVKPVIEKGIADLDNTQFSLDEKEDHEMRERRKKQLRNSLEITSEKFNGYKSRTFGYFYRQAMIEEGHLSKEYIEMSKSENALKVWNFFTELNERARKMGYLDKQGLSFFPLIEATTLQKIMQSGNILKEAADFFKDMYTMDPNEQLLHASVDPETGEVKKSIPKFFTRINKDQNTAVSRDLNKVGLLWMKSLLEYEVAKELEFPLLTMHSVEKSKGTILTDASGNIIIEGNNIKVNKDENKNADILQTILDDYLYGIEESIDSLGSSLVTQGVSKFTKDKEKIQDRTVSVKKAFKTGDAYIRTLALGLKPLIGIANWAGAQMQMYISSSNVYDWKDFQKNHFRAVIPGEKGISLIERFILNTITPLTGESPLQLKQRMIAEKKSLTNLLSSWTFSDVMMITQSAPEKRLEIANALSMIENSMIINGKIINIRQYLKAKDRQARKNMSFEERKKLEKSFEDRVKELKSSPEALKNIAKIENDQLVIPGVTDQELANFRLTIIDHVRNLNGQMSSDDKMGYRRDTIFSSFMMFKGWIPKLVSVRAKAITENTITGEWEYGRYRVFLAALREVTFKNITDIRDIYLGNDKGLEIINRMLEEKKQNYFLLTGKELMISPEEYQDLIRQQLSNNFKELKVVLTVIGLLIASKLAAPDDDEDEQTKNIYKYFAKGINKISDEVLFFVNPMSADEMTRGSILPSLGIISKVFKAFGALSKEVYYEGIGDDKGVDKTYPTKYFINLIPVGSQFQNEVLPLIDPELAKEMGIRVTAESRRK